MDETKQVILDELAGMKDRNDYFFISGLINMALLCEVITVEESINLTKQAGKKLEEIVLEGL